jgi:Flp pilus assembly protein TadG
MEMRLSTATAGGWARTPAASRQGVATVEMALVLPVLIVLLFGIIEFGLVFKDRMVLSTASREATRIAALGRPVAEVISRGKEAASTLTVTSLTVTPEYRTYSAGAYTAWQALANAPSGTTNTAPTLAQVRVTMSYPHHLVTGSLFAGILGDGGTSIKTLTTSVVMTRE